MLSQVGVFMKALDAIWEIPGKLEKKSPKQLQLLEAGSQRSRLGTVIPLPV